MEKVFEILNKAITFASGYVDGLSPMRTVICSILFLTLYALYLSFVRSKTGTKVISWVDGKIKEETNKFSWADVVAKQRMRGVDFYTPKMMLPHYYILIHVFVVAVFGVMIFLFAPKLTFLCLAGLAVPSMYYRSRDKKDNSEIVADVMGISSALSVQITGGEYLGNAVCECKEIVNNKRLKAALYDFDRNIKMGSMTLLEAINDLAERFTSSEIQTLCIILRQGIETGRTVDCANDLSKQCLSARESEFEARKGHLDRIMTLAMLLVYADGIGFIMYKFLSNLSFDF